MLVNCTGFRPLLSDTQIPLKPDRSAEKTTLLPSGGIPARPPCRLEAINKELLRQPDRRQRNVGRLGRNRSHLLGFQLPRREGGFGLGRRQMGADGRRW